MIDRKEIREALLARREILTRETDLSQVETVELDQTRVGRLSRAGARTPLGATWRSCSAWSAWSASSWELKPGAEEESIPNR